MFTTVQLQNTVRSRTTRHLWQLLVAVLLIIAFTLIGHCANRGGNRSGRDRWLRVGSRR
jgi:hypothetical protein